MAEKVSSAQPVESFEHSLAELEKVVHELETADLSLERSIALFERGIALSEVCGRQLQEAETRVDMLIRKEGKMAAEPFSAEKTPKA